MATIDDAKAYVALNRALIDEAYESCCTGFSSDEKDRLAIFLAIFGAKDRFDAITWLAFEFGNLNATVEHMRWAADKLLAETATSNGEPGKGPLQLAVEIVEFTRKLKGSQRHTDTVPYQFNV